MEDSAIPLDKWLTTAWLVTNCKNGISSYEIARDVKVTQKSAWFMLHRIRLLMQDEDFGSKLGGEVEADETFIGGKARNMHRDVHARRITGGGQEFPETRLSSWASWSAAGAFAHQVIADRQKETLQPIVREHVEVGAALFTDGEIGRIQGTQR